MTDNLSELKNIEVVKDPDPAMAAVARRQQEAAKAIISHFESHPDGVIIASISEGRIRVDVSNFGQLGELLFAHKLLSKFVDESFDKALSALAGQDSK